MREFELQLEELKKIETRSKNFFRVLDFLQVIYEKISCGNYYFNQELSELRKIGNSFRNYKNKVELYRYKTLVKQYMDFVKYKVKEAYIDDPKHFNMVVYYSITDISPLELFSEEKKMKKNHALCDLINKTVSSQQLSMFEMPRILTESSFKTINSYTYQNVTLSREKLLEIYHSMDPHIPKYEDICYEFFKDYIRKQKNHESSKGFMKK